MVSSPWLPTTTKYYFQIIDLPVRLPIITALQSGVKSLRTASHLRRREASGNDFGMGEESARLVVAAWPVCSYPLPEMNYDARSDWRTGPWPLQQSRVSLAIRTSGS